MQMKLYLPGWEILDLTIDYIELFSILTFLTIIIFGGLEYFDRFPGWPETLGPHERNADVLAAWINRYRYHRFGRFTFLFSGLLPAKPFGTLDRLGGQPTLVPPNAPYSPTRSWDRLFQSYKETRAPIMKATKAKKAAEPNFDDSTASDASYDSTCKGVGYSPPVVTENEINDPFSYRPPPNDSRRSTPSWGFQGYSEITHQDADFGTF